jgi:DNA-binding CsgD family transcriptional regulator
MTTLNAELLSLYNGCRTLPVDQFQVAIFDHLKALIPFDSARLIGVDTAHGGAEVRSSILYREPEAMNLDWEAVATIDNVLSTVSRAPGRSCNFNARLLYTTPALGVVLDYTTRYRHLNGLVVATTNGRQGFLNGLSLYRARDERHFKRTEQRSIEAMAPHIQQALQINRALALGEAQTALPFAIVSDAGMLNFCTPALDELIRTEFVGWHGLYLPVTLHQQLVAHGSYNLRSRPMRLSMHRFGTAWLMGGAAVSPGRLTPRENAVAMLFIHGNSHKEVARELGVAPSTVRNFLQKIYQKLDVHDKASLALLLTGK